MSTPFVGELRLFPYNFAPRSWATCSGQILSIAQNTALFSLLGTTYGGNGQTTFALPDLRGRAPIGQGQGPGLPNFALGQLGGSPTHTLLTNEMPAHVHAIRPSVATSSTTKNPVGSRPGPTTNAAYATAGGSPGPADPKGADQITEIVGGNQPHNIMQPYLTMTWCIALEGIFPSRN